MARLCFRIAPTFLGPVSVGTVRPIALLRERLGLSLAGAKALVDRAVFDGEEVGVEVPSAEAGWRLAGAPAR